MSKKETRKDVSFPHAAEIEKIIGYTFTDKSLLAQAFTRTSFCNEVNSTSKIKYQSSEVLEFFGDSVLSAAIISLLLGKSVTRYEGGIRTELNEGDLSNIKSKLSDKKNLSKSTHALGLERFLRMGEGDKKLGVDEEPSVREDLYESIIGAVYIDSGMNLGKVIPVVERTLDLSLYNNPTPPIQSAKNALQEWCQNKARRLPPPQYKTLGKEGPDHKTTYEVGCYVNGELIAKGKGKNEKLAGAAAAEAALLKLTAKEEKSAPKEAEKKNTQIKSQNNVSEVKSAKAPKVSVNKNEDSQEEISQGYSLKLKAYAKQQKILSPTFVDLGMQKENGIIIHRVECRLKDKVKIAKAKTREMAKEEAARLILEDVISKKPSVKKAPSAKKAQEKKRNKKRLPEPKK